MALSTPTPEQVSRELRNSAAAESTERAWRRQRRRLVAGLFIAQGIATLIGVSGFVVDGPRLGRLLLAIGQAGVVVFPFGLYLVWMAEANRRGDL